MPWPSRPAENDPSWFAERDAWDEYAENAVDAAAAAVAGKESAGVAASLIASHHAASSADHDDRYYTESEADALLAGKAATSHGHTAADTSDFAEVVRDTIGSTLVAGSNVTINVNDTNNTITISSTATDSGPSGYVDIYEDAYAGGTGGSGGSGGVSSHADLTDLSAPGHSIDAIIGLQTVLEGKADESHVHTEYAPSTHSHGSIQENQPWVPGGGYVLGDQVTYAGSNYRLKVASETGNGRSPRPYLAGYFQKKFNYTNNAPTTIALTPGYDFPERVAGDIIVFICNGFAPGLQNLGNITSTAFVGGGSSPTWRLVARSLREGSNDRYFGVISVFTPPIGSGGFSGGLESWINFDTPNPGGALSGVIEAFLIRNSSGSAAVISGLGLNAGGIQNSTYFFPQTTKPTLTNGFLVSSLLADFGPGDTPVERNAAYSTTAIGIKMLGSGSRKADPNLLARLDSATLYGQAKDSLPESSRWISSGAEYWALNSTVGHNVVSACVPSGSSAGLPEFTPSDWELLDDHLNSSDPVSLWSLPFASGCSRVVPKPNLSYALEVSDETMFDLRKLGWDVSNLSGIDGDRIRIAFTASGKPRGAYGLPFDGVPKNARPMLLSGSHSEIEWVRRNGSWTVDDFSGDVEYRLYSADVTNNLPFRVWYTPECDNYDRQHIKETFALVPSRHLERLGETELLMYFVHNNLEELPKARGGANGSITAIYDVSDNSLVAGSFGATSSSPGRGQITLHEFAHALDYKLYDTTHAGPTIDGTILNGPLHNHPSMITLHESIRNRAGILDKYGLGAQGGFPRAEYIAEWLSLFWYTQAPWFNQAYYDAARDDLTPSSGIDPYGDYYNFFAQAGVIP